MGITPSGLDFLMRHLPYHHTDWRGLRMLELGNQHFHDDHSGLMQRDGSHVAGLWFAARGIEHVSVDLNGQDGALPRDICSDLSDLGRFDIVTNFGSSEHVDDQEACFYAFQKLCKPGGLMIHSVPLRGNWVGHCSYWYTMEFFALLATLNNYRMVHRSIDTGCGDGKHLLNVALESSDDDVFVFPWSALK